MTEQRFTLMDDLLRWVWEQRQAGLSVVSADNPMNRTVGFSTEDCFGYIRLTDIRTGRPTPEGMGIFGERPPELESSVSLVSTPQGRHWVATGELKTQEELGLA